MVSLALAAYAAPVTPAVGQSPSPGADASPGDPALEGEPAEPGDTDEAPADPRESAFQEAIEEALIAYRGGNWADARALFIAAHRIRPSANAVRLGAVCSYELREYPVALRGFEAALSMREAPLSEQQRAEAEDALQRTARFLGVLALRVTPDDAAVTVDGVLTEPDGQGRVLLAPGSHELRVEAPGFRAFAQRLTFIGGERETLDVALEQATLGAADAPPEREPSEGRATSEPAPAPALSAAERRALAQRREERALAEARYRELDREAFEVNGRNRRRLRWGRFFLATGAVTTLGAVGLRFWADYDENQDRAVAAGCTGCSAGDPGLQDDLRRASGPLIGTGVTLTAVGAVMIFVGKRRRWVVDASEERAALGEARARSLECGPLGAGLRCSLTF